MADGISRGDVWLFDRPGGFGLSTAGEQLAVVVQTDAANHQDAYRATMIVPVSNRGIDGGPPHVKVEPTDRNGLRQVGYIKTEQIYTVLKASLKKKLGRLDSVDLERLDEALKATLAIG